MCKLSYTKICTFIRVNLYGLLKKKNSIYKSLLSVIRKLK